MSFMNNNSGNSFLNNSFLNSNGNSSSNNNLDSLYAEMAKLRAAQNSQTMVYRTVFNDINDEWSNCTEDERNFINADIDYQNANIAYQQQFNAFLLDLVGTQFINSQYGKSAEVVLATLKSAKSKYKKNSADNIATVKAENAELQKQLQELRQMLGIEEGGK